MTSLRVLRLTVVALAFLALLATPAQAGWIVSANNQVFFVSDTGALGGSFVVPGAAGTIATGVTFNTVTSNYYLATAATATGTNQIIEYNNTSIIAGPQSGGAGALAVNNPGGLTLDAAGNVYVANTGNAAFVTPNILRFNSALTSASEVVYSPTQISGERYVGLAFGTGGVLFATANVPAVPAGPPILGEIARIPVGGGAPDLIIATPASNTAGAIVFGPDGFLYVVDGTQVDKYDQTLTHIGAGAFITDAALTGALGIAFGADGNIYIANNTPTGTVREYNGTSGALINASFFTPTGGMPRFLTFSTPEPGSLTLVALGSVAGLLGYGWRRRKSPPTEGATPSEPEEAPAR